MRSHFIHLLTTKELIHHNPVTLKAAKMLQWLLFKSLKIANVIFSAETERSTLLVQYFELFGNFVRCMHFRDKNIEMEMLFLIACYCKNINILRCTDVSLPLAFYAILRNNPNIREIWVHNATCVLSSLMMGLSFHKLQLFSVKDMDCPIGFPWSESTHSTSLQRVEFVNAHIFLSDINALARNCPSIRSLSCAGIRITDLSLQSYLLNMPELVNLSMSGNTVATDDSVLFITQNLACLRTLNIQKCKELTVQSLVHIAEHARQLEVLYVDINDSGDAMEQAVELFSQKCTNITFSNINCNFILCTTTCTSSLLNGCPSLRTLVINEFAHITRTTRKLCALVKPQL